MEYKPKKTGLIIFSIITVLFLILAIITLFTSSMSIFEIVRFLIGALMILVILYAFMLPYLVIIKITNKNIEITNFPIKRAFPLKNIKAKEVLMKSIRLTLSALGKGLVFESKQKLKGLDFLLLDNTFVQRRKFKNNYEKLISELKRKGVQVPRLTKGAEIRIKSGWRTMLINSGYINAGNCCNLFIDKILLRKT